MKPPAPGRDDSHPSQFFQQGVRSVVNPFCNSKPWWAMRAPVWRSGAGWAGAALALTLLGGCGSAGVAERAVTTPAQWDAAAGSAAAQWPALDWWRGFGSEELDGLIAQAKAGNLDLAGAAARLLQAEAQARVAGAALLPTVSLGASGSRSGTVGQGNAASSYGADLGASYEIDFWGRNRANRDAAEASLRGSGYARDTVALTVTAGVANSYLQVLSLRERLAIARLNLANAERVLALVESKVRHGAVSRLDLAQQRSVLANQRAAIPPLEQQERDARSALAILLGRAPQNFTIEATELRSLQVPGIVPGLPAQLLARRPDIRASEAQLAAADANLAAARAALFPSVGLTGSLGVQNSVFSDLFDNDPVFRLGASLSQSIFDGGRLRGQRDAAQARQLELLSSYRATVLAAFADVESALGSAQSLAEQERLQAEVVTQASLAFQLAEARYRNGAVDLLNVLDAQRTLYSAQDQARQLRLARLQALVGLFRALGGGWSESVAGNL